MRRDEQRANTEYRKLGAQRRSPRRSTLHNLDSTVREDRGSFHLRRFSSSNFRYYIPSLSDRVSSVVIPSFLCCPLVKYSGYHLTVLRAATILLINPFCWFLFL